MSTFESREQASPPHAPGVETGPPPDPEVSTAGPVAGNGEPVGPPYPIPGEPVKLARVLELEAAEIRERRRLSGLGHRSDANLAGLSLSGGGIRSACFSLGLLEGLDRLPYAPPPEPLKPASEGGAGAPSHLEYFDYVSNVSGGSYAAGHLATAMMPAGSEWLGKVPLTSKTVPGWLWGLGVWFLGMAFQVVKSVALLVCGLALAAFVMRMLDAPDVMRFCHSLGLVSDISRGFAPFWLALGVFLAGYWIDATSRAKKTMTPLWFGFATLVIAAYAGVAWWTSGEYPAASGSFEFRHQYAFLACLIAPVLGGGVLIGAVRAATWALGPTRFDRLRRAVDAGLGRPVSSLRASLAGRLDTPKVRAVREAVAGRPPICWLRCLWDPPRRPTRLRTALLIPLLVALFCFAGLVATGDVSISTGADDAEHLARAEERSRWMGEQGDRIYNLAWIALALASLGFLFPKDLFKSARRIENAADAPGRADAPWYKSLGWEPVFRVVVFLCSYGFVLLLVFVLFSTVAQENVSGFYDWRKDIPSAAFHPLDVRDPDRAWERIARDAAPIDQPNPWTPLASRLMEARNQADYPLAVEQEVSARIRLLESLPWITRIAWPITPWGLPRPWTESYHASPDDPSAESRLDPSAAELYRLLGIQQRGQHAVAASIAEGVLDRVDLYKSFPPAVDYHDPKADRETADKYRGLGERYRQRAEALAALGPEGWRLPAVRAAVRNNNRRALHLYLPGLLRDRRDRVVFASIVWREDQWTRLQIAAVAGLLWLLCCSVDVNAFALQKFYRGHVIDCWVRTADDGGDELWLYQTGRTYRGWRPHDPAPRESPARRSPLLLVNATLEGNRSLGDEPDLPGHVFTFSPLASGSGVTKYWAREGAREEFSRRNRLDVGNIVATSGAFLAPGTIANPALSAVLHLLNIQTGYWVHDPKAFAKRSPGESLKFHACQSLGIDCDKDSRFMLTDGAHVENLGLYVLLQRRCSLIVVSDCGQEERGAAAERRFDALIQVLQQAGVDGIQVGPFLSSTAYRAWLDDRSVAACGCPQTDCHRSGGVGLDLVLPREARNDPYANPDGRPSPASPESAHANGDGRANGNGNGNGHAAHACANGDGHAAPRSQASAEVPGDFAREHFVFAQLLYPGGRKGLLVYLRPTLTGDEGDGLLLAARSSAFPDDDPVDQFYTPAKMSLYRLLGRHIATELAHDPVMRAALHQVVQGREVDGRPADDVPTCDCCAGGPASRCLWSQPRPFRACSPVARA